jgi:hypothetical protein
MPWYSHRGRCGTPTAVPAGGVRCRRRRESRGGCGWREAREGLRRWSRAFSRRGAASRAIAWRRRRGAPRSRPARPTLARKTAARFQSRRRVRAYGQYGVGNVVLSVREYGSAGYVPTDSKGSGTWYYRYGSTDESGTCLRIVRRREHANNRPAGDGRRAPQRAMVRQACSAQR